MKMLELKMRKLKDGNLFIIIILNLLKTIKD